VQLRERVLQLWCRLLLVLLLLLLLWHGALRATGAAGQRPASLRQPRATRRAAAELGGGGVQREG
jgi:hypothetical protein